MIGSTFSRSYCRTLTAMMVVIIVMSAGSEAQESQRRAIPLEVVLIWIDGGVNPERAWIRELEPSGIDFDVDAQAEAAMRAKGATDAWIAVVRNAAVKREKPRTTSVPELIPRTRATRSHLRLLYFGNESRLVLYSGSARISEVTPIVGSLLTNTDGTVQLLSPKVAGHRPVLGIAYDYKTSGFLLEAVQADDFFMLLAGVKLSPFLPIGASKIRFAPSVTPLFGFSSQTLAHLAGTTAEGHERKVVLSNWVAGGDIGLGFAYHWKPGTWILVEPYVRRIVTMKRYLSVGDEPASPDPSWEKWRATALGVRVGIGF